MDFSQLPKMSKTPPTPSDVPPVDAIAEPIETATVQSSQPTHSPRTVDYATSPIEFTYGSVWISLIAGIIFLAMGQTFARFLIAHIGGHEFATGVNWTDGPKTGEPVAYFDLLGGTAWNDMGLFLMGVVLLLDAAIMALWAARRRSNRTLVMLTLGLTILAMLVNVGVIFYLFSIGIMPLISLIALLVGGFVVFDHGPMIRKPR